MTRPAGRSRGDERSSNLRRRPVLEPAHGRDTVDLLQVAPADAAPPAGVQVAVDEWMVAYRTWLEQS